MKARYRAGPRPSSPIVLSPGHAARERAVAQSERDGRHGRGRTGGDILPKAAREAAVGIAEPDEGTLRSHLLVAQRIGPELRQPSGVRAVEDDVSAYFWYRDGKNALFVTSTGEVRPFIRYGLFRLEADGQVRTLVAFKAVGEDGGGRLFLPFQDRTSGRSTYGGGRSLDLDESPDGRYVLDFNQAYHPYCVYNPMYSCPIPPPENRIGLAVTAGEQLSGEPAVPAPN